MACRSLFSRVVCTPAMQVFCSHGIFSTALLSYAFTIDHENTRSSALRPWGLKSSIPCQRHANLSRKPSVSLTPLDTFSAPLFNTGIDVKVENAIHAGLRTSPAALEGYFETFAVVGRVECNSRGCRPLLDDALEPATLPDGWLAQEDAFEVLKSRTASYQSRSRIVDLGTNTHFPKDFADFLNEMWMEKGAAKKYFEFAVRANPLDCKLLCEYASFSWKALNDADKAEVLYKQALEAAPDDPNIVASYALFLWQSDL